MSDQPDWHAMPVEAVEAELGVGREGLTTDQAQQRLARYGPNRLAESRGKGPLLRFLIQFHNVLIYVLLAAAAVTAALEHWVDTGVILGVVLINALIGYIQEGKAEDALRAIRNMLSPKAMGLRDGHRVTLTAEEVVPGDVVFLQSGDRVPADLRLFRVKSLRIQESVLTGESVAVEKETVASELTATLGDRTCIAYSGTLVTYGQGEGLVVATGADTEIGRISSLVASVETLTTPLLRQMTQFGQWLTMAILVIAGVTFAFGYLLRGYSAAQMFLAAVGLSVAAIPEGLPAIMTITLAIGVQRMAARKAIIRRLPAVETLGSVSVICSDKTGTLTRNEMTVSSVAVGDQLLRITGAGYDPHGVFRLDGEEIKAQTNPVLMAVMRAGVLCNDASAHRKDGSWRLHGDPMETALLVAGLKAGLDPGTEEKQFPRTDLIPFESEHRFMATLHHSHTGEAFVFLKGAPERVLPMCTHYRDVSGDQPLDAELWHRRVDAMARQGQRVLALACRSTTAEHQALVFDDVESGMVLLGLFGLIDPPRGEAIKAIEQCRAASVRVKMITGDHAITAVAIAHQLNLENHESVLTGVELDGLSDEVLRERVGEVDVYARVSPEHKLRLVTAMQANGQVIAMTGDGVNDAPALKRADVGVAMGKGGTEAAKEASEMVLADDNFASIAHAVEEGRTVYANIRKAILFILPTNGGEALTIIAAILFGFHQLPLTPVQILWVNMITAVTLALTLAFEPPEPDVMRRPPRDASEPLLSGFLIWRIAFVSIIILVGTYGLFLWDFERGSSIEHARTVAVNTLVMFEIFYLFNSRYLIAPVLNREGLLGNRYALIAIGLLILFQMGFTYLPPAQALFGTAAIGPDVWARIVLVTLSILFLVEIEKIFVRRFERARRARGLPMAARTDR